GPGQLGGGEVVAQRRPGAVDLVGGDLLALTAAADDDAEFGVAGDHRAGGRRAERRVVDGRLAVGPQVGDVVPGLAQVGGDQRLQAEPGVVGGDGDAHDRTVAA